MHKKKKHIEKLNGSPMNQGSGTPSLPTGQSFGQTSQSDQSSGTYHQSCQTLLYNTFLEIITTGDVHLLLISGRADSAQLRGAWEYILQEYSETIQTEKTTSISSLWRKIVYTKWKINFLEQALGYLKHEYDHTIAESIMNIGYRFIENHEDREKYLKQIYIVENEAKTLIVLLNQYNNEYKLLNPDGDSPMIRTMADYDKELAILSKYMGNRIRKTEITVAEVAAIINLYLDEVKAKR